MTLYQGVTLGGTGKEQGKRHPTVGDNVMISAGAKVLGSFTIGENSKIGAGSVVLSAVPPNSTVVGVPGRVVRRYNQPLPRETLDQVHLPDPVREDIMTLQKANSELINRVLELEVEVKRLEKKRNRKTIRKETNNSMKIYNTLTKKKKNLYRSSPERYACMYAVRPFTTLSISETRVR